MVFCVVCVSPVVLNFTAARIVLDSVGPSYVSVYVFQCCVVCVMWCFVFRGGVSVVLNFTAARICLCMCFSVVWCGV
jgi:hypothetical protein